MDAEVTSGGGSSSGTRESAGEAGLGGDSAGAGPTATLGTAPAAAAANAGGFGYNVSDGAAAVVKRTATATSAAPTAVPVPAANHVRAADPNRVRKADGASALFVAAQDGYFDVVSLLLAYKADPNLATTDGGDTPLQMAAQENAADVARALLEHNANPDFVHPKHSNGVTALHIAAQLGNEEVLSVLIEFGGANVNAVRAESGATPLIAAAQRGHANVVHKLLAAGADPSVTLVGGKVTAADVANRYPALQDVLEEALGKARGV